ncbi:hypothetical protein BGZ49_004731 [Haplosporangium sp. Z 27]|nr:hypothetical protein BGZ49_004731 [Haplosporangium sp. Z 27]
MSNQSAKSYLGRPSASGSVLLPNQLAKDHSSEVNFTSSRGFSDSNTPRSVVTDHHSNHECITLEDLKLQLRECANKSDSKRKSLTMINKRSILLYIDRNPGVSLVELSKEIDVSRTTIQGFKKNKNEIFRFIASGNVRGDCRRMTQPQDSRLETAMRRRISRQREEMDISHMVKDVTPVGKDTIHIGQDTNPIGKDDHNIVPLEHSVPTIEFVHRYPRYQVLSEFKPDDIYTFGLAKKFIGKVPMHSSTFCHYPDGACKGSTFLTVLFSNVSGTDKQCSLAFVERNSSQILESTDHNGEVHFDNCTDFYLETFQKWLYSFDLGLRRNILLFVDGAAWDLLRVHEETFLGLDNSRVIKVYAQGSIFLPSFLSMNSQLEKEFNHHYASLFNSTSSIENLIKRAWSQVPNLNVSIPIIKFLSTSDPVKR